MADAIQIDVISDVVCPWCYIGKRRLDAALAQRPDVAVSVNWRPFQLDPTVPPEGTDRHAYMARKFGSEQRVAEVSERVRAVGETVGIPFAFEAISRQPNTLDAHRLIRWSAGHGVQDYVVETLFQLYFVQGGDIGDRELLLAIAEAAGMDVGAIEDMLRDGTDSRIIEAEIERAHKGGITGVPCFIIDNRYMVKGAQDESVLVQAIDAVLAESGAA